MNLDSFLEEDFEDLKEAIASPVKSLVRLERGERRDAAVLFLDLQGFTAMSEKLDQEDVIKIINRAFVLFTKVIEKYLGYVDKYEGDAIMAIFGGKRATEKDTENAILAALEMQKVLEKINQFLNAQNQRLGMRIGVDFGEVVVTEIGYGEAQDETIYGPTVNLASRLESLCPVGSICVTEETYGIVRRLFVSESFGQHTIKGIDDPVALRLITGREKKDVERWQRATLLNNQVFVGRDAELRSLVESVTSWRERGAGVTGVILSGPSGIGKSRLVNELIKQKECSMIRFIKGQCESYFPPALSPVTSMLKSWLGMARHEVASQSRLSQALTELSMQQWELELLQSAIGYLLKVPARDGKLKELDGAALKNELINAFICLMQKLCETQPTMLFLDDLQWLDELSIDFFTELFKRLDAPLFVVMAAREYFAFPDAFRSTAQPEKMILQPLDENAQRSIISGLLGNADLPESFLEKLMQYSAGVPFYLEEYLLLLVQEGYLLRQNGDWRLTEENLIMPASLKSLVLSRIDHLAPEHKETLRTAAVLGQRFLLRLLHDICQKVEELPAENLQSSLRMIENLNYIIEHASDEDLAYSFRDILTHEAVYHSLLKSNRKVLHRLAAEAIESLACADDLQDEVAEHWFQANETEKAKAGFERAVEASLRMYDTGKALHQLSRLIALHEPDAQHWQLEKARILRIRGELTAAVDLCRSIHDDAYAGEVELALAEINVDMAEWDIARAHIEKALTALKSKGEHQKTVRALELCATIEGATANWPEAKRISLKTLDLSETIGDTTLIAMQQNSLGVTNEMLGDYDEARERYHLALHGVKGDRWRTGMILGNLANLAWKTGDLDRAEKLYREQLINNQQMSYRKGCITAAGNLAACLLDQGEEAEAETWFDQSLQWASSIGDRTGVAYAQGNLADMYRYREEYDRALEISHRNIDTITKIHDYEGLAQSHGVIADIKLAQEAYTEAETHYREALALAETHKLAWSIPYYRFGLANLKVSIGEKEEATRLISQAMNEARQMQREPLLDALRELAELAATDTP